MEIIGDKMICEKCGKEFNSDYRKHKVGDPRYCSRSCACSRDFSSKTRDKIATSNKKYYASLEIKPIPPSRRRLTSEGKQRLIDGRKHGAWTTQENARVRVLQMLQLGGQGLLKDYGVGIASLKKYVREVEGDICAICGQSSEWENKYLMLQLDHRNGDSRDNRLDNLRLLCPNCHSQTDTFSGRNMGKGTREYISIKVNSN